MPMSQAECSAGYDQTYHGYGASNKHRGRTFVYASTTGAQEDSPAKHSRERTSDLLVALSSSASNTAISNSAILMLAKVWDTDNGITGTAGSIDADGNDLRCRR